MKILQTQQALSKAPLCNEQHFHIVVCLEQHEVTVFMEMLHRSVLQTMNVVGMFGGPKPAEEAPK